MLEILRAELRTLLERGEDQKKLLDGSKAAMDAAFEVGLTKLGKTIETRWKRQSLAYNETVMAIGEVQEAIKKIQPDLDLPPVENTHSPEKRKR